MCKFLDFMDLPTQTYMKWPLVKHYNQLLEIQSSEWGKDEVTYFYVREVIYIHLGIKYANFQKKPNPLSFIGVGGTPPAPFAITTLATIIT